MYKNRELLINAIKNNLFNGDSITNETDLQIKNFKLEAVKKLKTENIVSIFDSLDTDSNFFEFCKEYNYTVENINLYSIVSMADREQNIDCDDPYIACGSFYVKKGDCEFIKFSNFSNLDDEKIIAASIMKKEKYEDYFKFKKQYQTWLKGKQITISVIGGDPYNISGNKKVEDLFFGEQSKLKDDVFLYINDFFNKGQLYFDNNIPWKSTILIEGEKGCGKTELINTIISNFNVSPITINKYNCDDSVLEMMFNLSKSVKNPLLIIEDIDELINNEFVHAETISEFIDKFNCNNGTMLILSTRQPVASLNEISFKFDKIIKLSLPIYKESIQNLFGEFINTSSIPKFSKNIFETKISYNYLKKIRDDFVLNCEDKDNKVKNIKELNKILSSLSKEYNTTNKVKKNIKIGLIKGRE